VIDGRGNQLWRARSSRSPPRRQREQRRRIRTAGDRQQQRRGVGKLSKESIRLGV
jgi:hypothetical protein